MKNFWLKIWHPAQVVLKRDLLSVFSAWAALAVSLHWIWTPYADREAYELPHLNLLLAFTAGISLFLAVRLWTPHRRDYYRWAAVAAFVVAVFTLIQWRQAELIFFRWLALLLLTHLLVALSPLRHWPVPPDEDQQVWRFNWHLVLRSLFGGFFSLGLALGLTAAIGASAELFGFRAEKEIYLSVYVIILYGLSVFQVLSTLTDSRVGPPSESMLRDLKRLVLYLFTPLVLLYFAIIYAYLVRLALRADWPVGTLGYLVSFLVAAVFLIAVIERPMPKGEFPAWIRKFWSLSFPLLLPPLAVLLMGTLRRVNEYGFTEARVALLWLALWATGIALLYTKPSRHRISTIPLTLAILVLVTLVGPLSPHFISALSQEYRFAKILERGGHTSTAAGPVWATAPSLKDRREMSSILRYMCETFGSERPWQMIGQEAPLKPKDSRYVRCSPNAAAHQALFAALGAAAPPAFDEAVPENLSFYDGDDYIFESADFVMQEITLGKLVKGPDVERIFLDYSCCKPQVTWWPDGRKLGASAVEIDFAPLVKRDQKVLEIPYKDRVLKLWLKTVSGSEGPDGQLEMSETVVFYAMVHRAGLKVERIPANR